MGYYPYGNLHNEIELDFNIIDKYEIFTQVNGKKDNTKKREEKNQMSTLPMQLLICDGRKTLQITVNTGDKYVDDIIL